MTTTTPTFNDLPLILTQINNNLLSIAQSMQGLRDQNVQSIGVAAEANKINTNLLATLVQMASADPVVHAANAIVSEATAAAEAAPAKRKRGKSAEDAAIKVSASFVAPEAATPVQETAPDPAVPAPVQAPVAPAPVPAPMPEPAAPAQAYEQKVQAGKDKNFGFGFGEQTAPKKPAFELDPTGAMVCNHLEGDSAQRYVNMTVEEQFSVLLGTAMPHMSNPAIRSSFLEFASTQGMAAPLSDPANSSLPGAGYRAVAPEVRLAVLRGLLNLIAKRTV